MIASASGGVWKSTNAGNTVDPIFDEYDSQSIGDVKFFQNDPSTIWVGTGADTTRNSVGWGDGVYKSTDGDDSWTELTNGLPTGDTGQIDIDIYRENPDLLMAYVETDDDLPHDMDTPGPGTYRIEVESGGRTASAPVRLKNDPML